MVSLSGLSVFFILDRAVKSLSQIFYAMILEVNVITFTCKLLVFEL